MQSVVKKVVYSFRYRLGPGQVGREVFHIVLRQCETHSVCLSGSVESATEASLQSSFALQIVLHVFHFALRECETTRSITKPVI